MPTITVTVTHDGVDDGERFNQAEVPIEYVVSYLA